MDYKHKVKSAEYFNSLDWESINTPRDWFENDLNLSHAINTLGIIIPETELFILKVLSACKHKIKSPDVLNKMEQFIAEEKAHSVQHSRFNKEIEKNGYNIKRPRKFIRFIYNIVQNVFSDKVLLAMAVGLEHNTIVCSKFALERFFQEQHNSEICDLFIWHCSEEIEHSNFLHNVYKDIGGTYLKRVLSMTFISILNTIFFIYMVVGYILKDKKEKRYCATRFSILKFYFLPKGMLHRTYQHYFSMFKFNYDP